VSEPDRASLERRLLVLAPTPKDADLARSVLERAHIVHRFCSHLDELCEQMDAGVGAVMLPEEAVAEDREGKFSRWLSRQPPWSDLPVLVLTRPGANSVVVAEAMEMIGNITIIERPTRVAALVSAVRTALRARMRQYQTRDFLIERERGVATKALLAAIVASSDDAIISKTLNGDILSWNAGAERIFGYTAEEAIGRPILLVIPTERHDEERVLLERLRRGERIDHFETVRVAKNGSRIDVSLTVSPIRDESGKIIGASKVARDITLRKQAEAALRDADRRKDEFLAILAHELRNPLAPIRNSLHILRLTGEHAPSAERVGEMMERQVNHMVRLVDDLLEVSRITRGQIELRKEPTDLSTVVRSAIEASRPLIESAGHELTVTLPDIPLTVEGDPVRLAQILSNLLNNAAKYTDPGGKISLEVRREDASAVLSVRDTGMGIPTDMLSRVFEMFMQVDRQADRAQGGLGIGLTLVKRLVEMHGGTVQARSEGAGRGTEFEVRLPVAERPHAAVQEAPSAAPTVASSRRALVVDDNRDSAESMGLLLELLGAEVRVVFDGYDALKAVADFNPAVVLLDIGMPGMDGHEVARRIRQQQEFQDIVLIALTGWGQEEDRRRSESAGFDHHLIKPADLATLRTLLDSLEVTPAGRWGRRGEAS